MRRFHADGESHSVGSGFRDLGDGGRACISNSRWYAMFEMKLQLQLRDIQAQL